MTSACWQRVKVNSSNWLRILTDTGNRFWLVISKSKTELQCIVRDSQQMNIRFGGWMEPKAGGELCIFRGTCFCRSVVWREHWTKDRTCSRHSEESGNAKKPKSCCTTLSSIHILYNAKRWTVKEEHKRKLRMFEVAVLRRICGVLCTSTSAFLFYHSIWVLLLITRQHQSPRYTCTSVAEYSHMTENHDQPSLINRTQLTRQSRRGAGRWA